MEVKMKNKWLLYVLVSIICLACVPESKEESSNTTMVRSFLEAYIGTKNDTQAQWDAKMVALEDDPAGAKDILLSGWEDWLTNDLIDRMIDNRDLPNPHLLGEANTKIEIQKIEAQEKSGQYVAWIDVVKDDQHQTVDIEVELVEQEGEKRIHSIQLKELNKALIDLTPK